VTSTLQAGQRVPFSTLGLPTAVTVAVHCSLPGVDVTAFGLQDGKLLDDRYMVFFNQQSSPHGEVTLAQQGEHTRFHVNLAALPERVTDVIFAATHDDTPVGTAHVLTVQVGHVLFDVQPHLKAEKAAMLVRLYRHQGEWRLAGVAQGFDGGLAELVRHFGGDVTDTPPASPKLETQQALLQRAEQAKPQLVNLIKTASVSLRKRGLDDARYRVQLVLDISVSMRDEYASGAVQALAERALALAARLDDNGEVDVYLFGIKAHRTGTLSLSNVTDFIDRLGVDLEAGTHYSPVMTLVREDARRAGTDVPTLVLFITDGGSSNRNAVIKHMRESASEPIFWKFMGIDQGDTDFDFLERLDDLEGRVVDNADFFKVSAPVRVGDEELFDLLTEELDAWHRDSRAAGIW